MLLLLLLLQHLLFLQLERLQFGCEESARLGVGSCAVACLRVVERELQIIDLRIYLGQLHVAFGQVAVDLADSLESVIETFGGFLGPRDI